MIQRIQTVFLFLAAVAAFGTLGLSFATTEEPIEASALFADAHFNVLDSPVLIGDFVLAGLMLLVAIFLFNNRKLQMTVTKLGLLVLGIGIGLGVYFFLNDQAQEKADLALGIGLPLVTIIFGYLAHVYIKKDENLVRSADRLR
ncbi:MAG: DUF4293 family protein [Bacteroidetes bacterium]|nr:MAG: DUF4293 family protein [Bacteroidota bacterium]